MDPEYISDQPTQTIPTTRIEDIPFDGDGMGDESITLESLPSGWRRQRWRRPIPRILPGRSRRSTKIIATVALVVLLMALLGVALATGQPSIHYARVKEGSVSLSFRTTGTLQSALYAASFLGSGQVEEIDVTVGEQVQQGQTLAKLNSTQLKDAANEAQASLASAQTQLSGAQTSQAKAQSAGDSAVAQAQSALDACRSSDTNCQQQKQAALSNAQAQADQANAAAQQAVNLAQAAVTTAQAKLQTAQDNLSGATLTASHAGVISSINGTVGSIVIGSNSTAPVTSFMQIADLSSLQMLTNVDASDAAAVAQGQVVEITVPHISKAISGKVEGISPIGQKVGQTLVYPATIDLDMSSAQANVHLLPGMSATAQIITQQAIGMIVPASAVAFAKAAGNPSDGGFLSKGQVTTALNQARQQLADVQVNGASTSQQTATPAFVLEYVKGKWTPVPVLLGLGDGSNYVVLSGIAVGEQIVSGEDNGPVSVPGNNSNSLHGL